MLDARVVPRDLMLVGIGWVVLLCDVVAEEKIGERFESVGVATRNPNRHWVVVADVDREGLSALAIEHYDPSNALEAREQVVLTALMKMEPTDHALP